MSFQYEYARPALTVDCVVFGLGERDDGDKELQILLIQRGGEPFRRQWALPGGFVNMDETVEEAARRELAEETGLTEIYLEQLYTFSGVDRDPRERVVSVAHYALVRKQRHRPVADTDADDVVWFSMDQLPELAFDHSEIISMARDRLRGKVQYQPIGFELLPQKFPLRDLQRLYEIVLGRDLDKRNFRKKILGMGVLRELDEMEQGVQHRAAKLYRFDRRAYRRIVRDGFQFEL